MIQTLQRKFIAITVFSLFVVLAVIMVAVNVVNHVTIIAEANQVLQNIIEHDGDIPKEYGKNHGADTQLHEGKGTPETKYFSVVVAADGTLSDFHINNDATLTQGSAEELARQALASGKTQGGLGGFRYLITSTAGEKLIAFVSISDGSKYAQLFVLVSAGISVAGLLLVFILVFFLSKRAVRPLMESYEKQKRFITDSSHELKTPLTVIAANLEVIEIENGSSEWTESIRNQIQYLTNLASNLTSLARIEEGGEQVEKVRFSLTDAVLDTVQLFFTVARAAGRQITTDIEEGIEYCGNEELLRRLVSVLMDNAIKYGSDGISISLTRHKGKIRLECSNHTAEPLSGNPNDYFDRFYRADSSRSKETGGFGIGLSMAKGIVEAHGGKITATADGAHTIRFTALL